MRKKSLELMMWFIINEGGFGKSKNFFISNDLVTQQNSLLQLIREVISDTS
jgi:hypothetical protein